MLKVLCCIFLAVPATLYAGMRHVVLQPNSVAPESLNVWIFFTDKRGSGTVEKRSSRVLVSEKVTDPQWSDVTSRPVPSAYIHRVQSCGGVLRHCFKWDNAASFRVPVSAIPSIRLLSCVRHVSLVGKRHTPCKGGAQGMAKLRQTVEGQFGTAYEQLGMIRVPEAQRYLSLRNPGSIPGEGVLIAFFDSGFRLDHRCLRHLQDRGSVIACYDFIDDDRIVADPDSVNRNRNHPLWGNDHHGTEVLSTVAALDTPWYAGAAWGGRFLLARTEDTFYDSTTGIEHELHTEEDNWAAAVVWAESLGVDIISSSLGYRYDFQDTVVVDRGNGVSDTIVDYLKSDLDGGTTIVSRAARYAVERGIIVVNAVGNEQNDGDTSLGAPADVDGVIAVGAVTSYGTLAGFSSLGPSADGRLKPDLVAPGSLIYLPDVNNPSQISYNTVSSGTSYATPLVAGICAMVHQAHPSMSSSQVREQLYRYCRLLPAQSEPDNGYGRGIPDAVRSCMRDSNELFVVAMDTGGVPLVGATVTDGSGTTLGTTTTSGVLRFSSENTITALVFTSGNMERRLLVGKLPFFREVAPCSLLIRVFDERESPIGSVKASVRSATAEWTVTGDSLGDILVTSFYPQAVSVVVTKPGYLSVDTLVTAIDPITSHDTMLLQASKRPFFEVFPTVVHKRQNEQLWIRFAPEATIREPFIHVSIRSMTGTLVWRKDVPSENTPVSMQWQVTTSGGGSIAPGTYFLLLSCSGDHYRKKILIVE